MESINTKLHGVQIQKPESPTKNMNKLDGGQDCIIKNCETISNELLEEKRESQSPLKMKCLNDLPASSTNVALITANVGSLFEDPIRLMPIWTSQLRAFLEQNIPGFVALHCQEVFTATSFYNSINNNH